MNKKEKDQAEAEAAAKAKVAQQELRGNSRQGI